MSHADLIGTTVDIEHDFPYLGSPGQNFIDANGNYLSTGDGRNFVTVSDTVPYEAAYPNTYTVDIKASSISVVFLANPVGWNWGNGITFNGLVVRDLQWAGEPDWILTNVAVTLTPPAQIPNAPLTWDTSRIQFGNDWVGFNWAGLSWYAGDTFDATLTFGPPSPPAVPEPSTLLIAGLCGAILLAYAWCRRRRAAA
jgi:hypothetical protein